MSGTNFEWAIETQLHELLTRNNNGVQMVRPTLVVVWVNTPSAHYIVGCLGPKTGLNVVTRGL